MAKTKNESELGPCQVLVGKGYCGQPAYESFADAKETTIPGAGVASYKSIGRNYFCPEHMREAVYINADGTVTFGKSSFELAVELEESADDGSNDI